MSEAHDPFAELAAGYALGALERRDVARFELHLADGCAACDGALADYRQALAGVAEDLREPPPRRVRGDLLERAAPRARRIGVVAAWAASLALAAGLAAVVTARRLIPTDQAGTLALLSDPATHVVSLTGLKPSPAAVGRVVWNPRAGGLFVAADLPRAPAGKTYELWAIAGGKPFPAGVFTVGPDGRGTVRVTPIAGVASVDVFAVTLEPAGGMPSPTGEMYLASKPA